MQAPTEAQHKEHWEVLAMFLAEVLRRVLDLPKPSVGEEDMLEGTTLEVTVNQDAEKEVAS